MSDIIDIQTRKKVEHIEVEGDTSVANFLNIMKKRCKKENVKSIFILTVDAENFCNWGMITDNEHHLLLAYATLDDLKKEILDGIFPVIDVELDD